MGFPFVAWLRPRSGRSSTVTREKKTHAQSTTSVSYCPAQPRRRLSSLGSWLIRGAAISRPAAARVHDGGAQKGQEGYSILARMKSPIAPGARPGTEWNIVLVAPDGHSGG